MNQIRIKKKGQRNWPLIIRAVTCFAIAFGALLLICVTTGARLFTFRHVLIYSLYSIPLCILYAYCVEKFGSGLGNILSGWSTREFTTREILAADLAKARTSKRKGEFEDARTIIEGVLDKDPDFPEALYVKAQILWEGFGKPTEAKRCLRRVMQVVAYDETLHRWASSYYDKLIAEEKKRVSQCEQPL